MLKKRKNFIVEGKPEGAPRTFASAKRLGLIEKRILPLVEILNSTSLKIKTIASCEGHGIDHSETYDNSFPYIAFKTNDTETITKLKTAIEQQMQKEAGANYNWQLEKSDRGYREAQV